MTLPIFVSLLVLQRLKIQGTPIEEPWQGLLKELSAWLGLRRRVTLLQSGRRIAPMTFGIFRPTILVPANAWPAQRWRIVLLHELAHIQRHDCLTLGLGHLARILLWFHPLIWLATRRLMIEAERACDDRVLAAGTQSSAYAEELLNIATAFRQHPALDAAALPMARRSTLETRVRGILDVTRSRRGLSRRAVLLGTFLVLCIVIPLACMRSALPKPPAPVASTSGATILGQVQDRLDGNPAAGVLVTLVKPDEPEVPVQTARTDAGGYYQFADVPYMGMLYLVQIGEQARNGGIWSDDVRIEFSEADSASHKVVSAPTLYMQMTLVTGRVIDADTGQPVPGVELNFSTMDKNRMSITTNAQGEYRLNVTPRELLVKCNGTYDRYFPMDGEKSLTIKDGRPQNLNFKVKSAQVFTGRVLGPDGLAVAYAAAQVTPMWHGGIFGGTVEAGERIRAAIAKYGAPPPPPNDGRIRTSSGGAGRGKTFFVTADALGQFRIYLRHPGEPPEVPTALDITMKAWSTDRKLAGIGLVQSTTLDPVIPVGEVQLLPSATLELTVLDPEGRKVPDAVPGAIMNYNHVGNEPWPVRWENLGGGLYRATGILPGPLFHFNGRSPEYRVPWSGLSYQFSPGEIVQKEMVLNERVNAKPPSSPEPSRK